MGMVAPTLIDVALAGVRDRDAGSASGVINASLQLGGAIGVAAIGVIFFGLLPDGTRFGPDPAKAFSETLRDTMWFVVGIYLLRIDDAVPARGFGEGAVDEMIVGGMGDPFGAGGFSRDACAGDDEG
jgi:hypothetical protein